MIVPLWEKMMADPGPRYLDLSFIERDVRNQLAHSRDILSQVEVLQRVLPSIQDPAARAQVEASINSLLGIAGGLSSNALSTSTNTGIVVGPMFEPSRQR